MWEPQYKSVLKQVIACRKIYLNYHYQAQEGLGSYNGTLAEGSLLINKILCITFLSTLNFVSSQNTSS